MSKSKYPEKIDTSIELPRIRDNITELNSDIINGIISAIIQIEKTLGINPNGIPGNTVSSRIARSLDDNGNIKKDALTQANILSGPISDSDISSVASIKENKLKLDFSTKLLQSEISILSTQLESIISQLGQVISELAVHVYPNVKNRHNAVSINVDSSIPITNTSSSRALNSGTLQGVLEELYNSHMNYTGDNISDSNSSHSAKQVFFDKESVIDVISGDDVQTAISELADFQSLAIRNASLNLSSNGRIRNGSTIDGFANSNLGRLLLDLSEVTYTATDGASRTTFNLVTPVEPLDTLNEFDVLTLSNSTIEANNKSYQISKVVLSGSNITSIEIYDGPVGVEESGLYIKVTKPIYGAYNSNGLNSSVRPRNNRTNTPDVLVANPDSPTIISSGINCSKLTSSSAFFDITIDDGNPISIEAYDSGQTIQTIDTIVNKINEQCVDQHLMLQAFKLKIGTRYELAISHMIPNFYGDIKSRTLKISESSSDDATSILGFENILDVTYYGTAKNKFHVNGYLLCEFGKIIVLDNSALEIVSSSNDITLSNGTFSDLGIRIGDSIIFENLSVSSENGAYRIGDINGDTATIDYDDSVFSGSMNDSSVAYIFRNAAVIDEMTFTEAVGTDGSILFDVFMDEKKDINYKKRMEIDGVLSSGPFTAAIVDVSKNFLVSGETGSVTVGADGFAYLTGPDAQDGESVYISATGIYNILSSDGLHFVTLDVNATDVPSAEVSVNLFGFSEVSEHNYKISRGLFGTSLGIILGTSTSSGVPSLKDKRKSGSVDDTIVGEALLEKYIEGPRNEIRSSGIISGLNVSNLIASGSYYTFDVSAGVSIVNGIRYEFTGIVGFKFATSSSFYISVDENGSIIAGDEILNPGGVDTDAGLEYVSPFHMRNTAHLAYIDATDDSIIDLRFFINSLDLKVANNIIVSKNIASGHFTTLGEGLDYARRISGIYNYLGTPKVLIGPGVFEIATQKVIDFDVIIEGCGPSTIIKKKTGTSLATGKAPNSGNIFMSKALFLIGTSIEAASSRIVNGVTLRDFTYESNDLTNVGITIAITQDLVTSPFAVFRIEGINFIGPSGMDGSVIDANKVGEYAVYMGRQNSAGTPTSSILMGNLIFKGNYLNKMGLENGAIYFTESSSSTFRDIVVTGNIAIDLSPNVSNLSVTIIEDPSTPTTRRFIETGNAVSD